MAQETSVGCEFEGAKLGDVRLNKRLGKIVEAVEKQPGVGFPKALVTDADAEGFYRFLSNQKVTCESLQQPHREATAGRAGKFDEVLVLHDTSVFAFTGDKKRKGLGKLRKSGHGFLGHFSLVLSATDQPEPLGVISCIPVVRDEETTGEKRKRGVPYREARAGKCESTRWLDGVDKAAELLSHSRMIHVADREADDYALLSKIVGLKGRFVIRDSRNRNLDAEKCGYSRLDTFLAQCKGVCTRSVHLSRHGKKPGERKGSQPRDDREAQLTFSAGAVDLLRPRSQTQILPESLHINVVHVMELDPPADMEPVDWTLFTTEPIRTQKQVLKVVDFYRARWVIEEYFKALKSGCSYLKRQLESRTTLLNALAILTPIAWNMLRMRSLSRLEVDVPAAVVLTERQIAILQALPATKSMKLDTVREVLLAVARLGGHLKHNGDPGWQTIALGYEDLLKAEVGYRLAEQHLLRARRLPRHSS